MRVFLADLGHNVLTISSDVYPLGIANLATYAGKYLDGVDSPYGTRRCFGSRRT
ncbi:MAG: hypothetical protein ACE5HQ_00275 [Gemmatimonadota bacterium]